MRGTLLNTGLKLADLQDMAHRLVGEPALCHHVLPTDTRKQRTACLSSYLVYPKLQPLLGFGRDIGQPFLIAFTQHLQRPVCEHNIFKN